MADKVEVFEGDDNSLTMKQIYTKKFQCEYQLARYPFDIQPCAIEMNVESLDEDTVTLVPGKIEMIENKELTMYTIEKWELVYRDKNTNAGIKMTVLVLTTIFIAVIDKLPSTSYVKMIDVWLIFAHLILFTEVVMLTAMEFYREGDD